MTISSRFTITSRILVLVSAVAACVFWRSPKIGIILVNWTKGNFITNQSSFLITPAQQESTVRLVFIKVEDDWVCVSDSNLNCQPIVATDMDVKNCGADLLFFF
uniref:Uncharacterized protein n=1 Tax=Caenorhabditis japonica TaxID=281687 RepID=A0A8R1ISM9_CAEJA